MIDATCGGCGQKYRLPESVAGKKAKCKACGATMTLPSLAAAPASKPALQSFGATPNARPKLQSFGTPASAAPRPRVADDEPLMEFEEVADDPYGLEDEDVAPMPSAGSRPPRVEDEIDGDLPAPGRPKGPGRPGGGKKSKRRPAGFWKRVCAYVIDGFVLLLLQFGIGFVIGFLGVLVLGMTLPAVQAVSTLASFVLNFLYFAGAHASEAQATPGKKAMGIKVCGDDGRRLSFGQSFIRELAKIPSGIILGIGFLMAAFTERKQALHDLMVGTLVVQA